MQVVFRIGIKLRDTSLRAEVICAAVVLAGSRRLRRLNRHMTDRVDFGGGALDDLEWVRAHYLLGCIGTRLRRGHPERTRKPGWRRRTPRRRAAHAEHRSGDLCYDEGYRTADTPKRPSTRDVI